MPTETEKDDAARLRDLEMLARCVGTSRVNMAEHLAVFFDCEARRQGPFGAGVLRALAEQMADMT